MWLSHTITIIWYQSFPQFMHSTGIMFLFDLCYMYINKNFTFYLSQLKILLHIQRCPLRQVWLYIYIYMWVMLLICMTFYSFFYNIMQSVLKYEMCCLFSALNRIKSWYILYFFCSIEIKSWYILYFSCFIEMRFIYSSRVLSWRT